MFQIESAGINPWGLIIDKDGRALTNSLVAPELTDAAQRGNAFYVVSDFVALTTTTSFSAVISIKNTSKQNLKMYSMRTCGTMVQLWKLEHDHSNGTLASSGAILQPTNLNLSSGNSFDGVVNAASADGQTILTPKPLSQWVNNVGFGIEILQGSIIISPQKNIALSCKPAAAGDVCAALLMYFCD